MRAVRFQFSVIFSAGVLAVLAGVSEVRAEAGEAVPRRVNAAPQYSAKATAATNQVRWKPVLPPLPEGVTDLPFDHVLVSPIGPKGLELSPEARQLVGKRVRLVGHMVRQMQPIPWTFLLSPVAQSLHEREYFLCDDLPANTVRVHVPKGPQPIVPYRPGLVVVTGTLTTEGPEESDGRSSVARLVLQPGDTNSLVFVTGFVRAEAVAAAMAATAPTQLSAPKTAGKSN